MLEFLGDNLYTYSQNVMAEQKRKGIFSIKQLKKITIRLLESICFLEKLGILHFDVKPENICFYSKAP